MTRSRAGTWALLALWTAVGALLVGVGREVYARTFLARMIHQTITVSPDVPLTRKDPVYGERPVPGHFEVSIDVPEASAPYTFTMDIDEDGYRTTSPDPAAHVGQPEVWIFGCSFTWGFPLDNEDSYPWLVQEALPGHRVLNLGVHGVGNLRALRQLRELLVERGEAPPEVAVFGYASFHKERNVRGAQGGGETGGLPGHILDYRDVLDPDALAAMDDVHGGLDLGTRVTFAILDEIAVICRAHGVPAVLAVQSLSGFDPVVPFARDRGFVVVPMQVDFRRAIYNLMPFDNHPNAEANRLYADALVPALRRLLDED